MSEPLDLDARCIRHPERAAERACARCGDFICAGCIVSGDICSVCKTRLFREGVPYSEEEKARSLARRYRRFGELLLQVLLVAGGLAVLIRMGLLAEALPGPLRWLAAFCAGVTLLSGLCAAVFAVLGLRQSRRGQPDPSVSGVFSLPYAGTMFVVGIAPALLALLWLSRVLPD